MNNPNPWQIEIIQADDFAELKKGINNWFNNAGAIEFHSLVHYPTSHPNKKAIIITYKKFPA